MTYLPKIISQVGNVRGSVCIHKMGARGRGRWAAVEVWRKIITSWSRVWIMKELAFEFVLYGQLGYWREEREREKGGAVLNCEQPYIFQVLPDLRTQLFLDKESKTSLGEPHPYLCDNRNSKLEFQSRKLLGPIRTSSQIKMIHRCFWNT